ncbi:MAG TPA: hypothetical protein VF125_06260 [Solirubrobacterales bacterium]
MTTATARSEGLADRIEAGTAELMARAARAYAAEDAWCDGIRAVAYELRRFLLEDCVRAREMVLDAPFADARARAVREQGIAGLSALIDLGRAELSDPDSLPPVVAEITAGSVYNRMHEAVLAGPAALNVEMVRELMYAVVLPYRGLEAAMQELLIAPPTE